MNGSVKAGGSFADLQLASHLDFQPEAKAKAKAQAAPAATAVEAAVVFVSGYLTNVTAIASLIGPQDIVIHDEFIHNSALTGAKLSGAHRRFFKHNDMEDLDRVLHSVAGRHRH